MAIRTMAHVFKAIRKRPGTSPHGDRPVAASGVSVVAPTVPQNAQPEVEQNAVIERVQSQEDAVIEVVLSQEDAIIEKLQEQEDAVIEKLQREIELIQSQLTQARVEVPTAAQAVLEHAKLRSEVESLHEQLSRTIQQLGWERERAEILNREALARLERTVPRTDESQFVAVKEVTAPEVRAHEALARAKREQERLERLEKLEQRFNAVSKEVIVELALHKKPLRQRLRRR